MRELYYGSLIEREALADAITNKGVDTNVSDSLITMAENVGNLEVFDYAIGSGTVTLAHNGNKTEDITFGKVFSKTPSIFIENSDYLSINVHNISTAGCRLQWNCTVGSTQTASYRWLAIVL